MAIPRQKTLHKEAVLSGKGIHLGKRVRLRLLPQEANSGISFLRTDLPQATPIKAIATNVLATNNNTTLGNVGDKDPRNVVHTIEHLLSALYALGIDNVLCLIDGPEVPIMDGSAASFLYILKEVGWIDLTEYKKFLVIKNIVESSFRDSWIQILPSKQLEIEAKISFPHPLIGNQEFSFSFSSENFITQISRARTFGLLKDVDDLKKRGLVKGGSLDNAVILNDFHVMNKEGMRFPDECVRHKVLDILGDISLLGYPLLGKILAYKSGHGLHNAFCRRLLESPSDYEIVSFEEQPLISSEIFVAKGFRYGV